MGRWSLSINDLQAQPVAAEVTEAEIRLEALRRKLLGEAPTAGG